MSVAWFVDGAYVFRVWQQLGRNENVDYLKLRTFLEDKYCDKANGEHIDESYFLNADTDPPTGKQNAFYNALAYPPPGGPGLRVKLYWLQKRKLTWPQSMGGKPVLHPDTGVQYELTQQKGVDVGLAFHMMRSFSRKQWNKLFLAAGDGDFHEVAQHLVENENVSLFLIGTVSSISEELRPYATQIIEIDKEAGNFSRPRQ
ncbi:MAG: NYN domain-containing protein [Candidatus Lambdaproteobacteria bacterium]|nr:NYN domain-containing protein [Candidatus Lambdaproteobacteria bacterium]